MATAEQLVRINGQAHEIIKRVANGSLDVQAVRQALQQIIEKKPSVQDSRFDSYNHLLLSLEDQKTRSLYYDRRYWGGRYHEQILTLNTCSNHTQRVDDLEVFHIQFASFEETVEMWWRVYVGEQPKQVLRDELKLDPEHLRPLTSNVRQYEPGIHRIRIDLAAHWEPENGRTLEEVRGGAKGTDEILAGLEVLSAYGLHSELFREQDGENLPYSDMPGTDVSVPGDSRLYALCVHWLPFYHEAMLRAHWVSLRSNEWAAPVLRES